jgi:radical SAM protein with 4Fe4S-binding SPASM domain
MWRAVERLAQADATRQLQQEHLSGRSPWLTSAKLKLVDGCNLRCFMCDYWRGRRQDELTTNQVLQVLQDLATLRCDKVHFSGGEIFLRKDALELFTAAHRLGLRVNLTTNGTLLDKSKVRALLELPVRSITLSLDSPVRRLHDEVRGQHGAFKRTLAALERLLAERGRKTRVRLNTVVSARTYRSLIALPELVRSLPLDGLLLIPMDVKPALTEEPQPASLPHATQMLPQLRPTPHVMTRQDIRRFNQRIAPLLADAITIPGFDAYPFGRSAAEVDDSQRGHYARGHYREHLCHAPWLHTLVAANGDLYPCCMGHRAMTPLGNVRQQSLLTLYNGEAYRDFRLAMLRSRPELCQRCDDFVADNRAIDAAFLSSQ